MYNEPSNPLGEYLPEWLEEKDLLLRGKATTQTHTQINALILAIYALAEEVKCQHKIVMSYWHWSTFRCGVASL